MIKTALPLLILLTGCATLGKLEKPKMSVQGAAITAVSFDAVDLRVDLAIDNPNGFGLNAPGIDFKLAIDGAPFLEGTTTTAVQIKSKGRTIAPLSLSVGLVKLLETVASLKDKTEVPYRVQGGFFVDTGVLGRIRLDFSHDGKLPIPRLPRIRMSGIKLDKLDLKSARGHMDLVIKNPNSFALSKLGGKIKILLDGTEVGDFDAALLDSVDADGEGSLGVALDIKVLKLLPQLAKGHIKAKLSGELGATTPFGPLRFPINLDEKVQVDK